MTMHRPACHSQHMTRNQKVKPRDESRKKMRPYPRESLHTLLRRMGTDGKFPLNEWPLAKTVRGKQPDGALLRPRKASQERVRFILEFSYGRDLQRPKYRRIPAQAADAGGRSDSLHMRNRDVRQLYSRRNGGRRPL